MADRSSELLNRFTAELACAAAMTVLDQKNGLIFEDGNRPARLDAWLLMGLSTGGAVEIAVDVIRTGYPRDIRLAIQQLLSFQKTRQGSVLGPVLCVVAEYLSPGSRDLLKQSGICYYDGTGAMYFKHRDYLIVKESGQKPREPRRAERFFTGARERVVHALLMHSHRANQPDDAYISGAELAQLAQTSPYTVSITMQALEREELVECSGSGPGLRRRLTDASRLLDAWATDWLSRHEVVTRWYAYDPTKSPTAMVIAALAEREGWALTGAVAANAVVSHLTAVDRVQVIVPVGCSQTWGAEMNFKQVDKGANILMIEREGASLMFSEQDPKRPGSRFASHFIQYLDLLDGYGRNKELAEVFRQQVLKM